MGVDAQVGNDPPGVVHHLSKEAPDLSAAGHPVKGPVGGGRLPGPALDHLIGGVLPQQEGEGPVDSPLLLHHIEAAQPDVLPEQLLRREGVPPLGGVSGPGHKGPGDGIDLTDAGKISLLCSPDHPYPLLYPNIVPGRRFSGLRTLSHDSMKAAPRQGVLRVDGRGNGVLQ